MSKKDKDKKVDPDDVIQAVVIADSFNFRFRPITVEQPRALLPLVNRPLIDYTVEFLAVAGVHEIFVFCCAHAEAIRAHLKTSRWMKPTSPVRIQVIVSEDCPSVGDALRDIDAQSLIRSDFVLVSGDLVANMELGEVIKKHRELKKKDKMLVMSCVYKKANPKHRTRSIEDDILICTSASNAQLLHCEKPMKQRRMNIPLSLLEEHGEVEVHYDVLDCHISVCSPTVPQLFSDNFDYQTRHHFIRGILVNEEILGNHIYAHIITDQYAARVCNLQTYDAVSKDVIHRWVYPLVPDNTDEACSYGRHNIYLNTNVSLAFGCELHEDVVIGRNSSVGMGTHITQSSIGHNCRIGDNVVIEGSYIWDHCVIENGSKVFRSILCDSVYVKSNVIVEPGCVLSYGVTVGPQFTVRAGSRLTIVRQAGAPSKDEGWGEEEQVKEEELGSPSTDSKPEDVGPEGRGFLWLPPPDRVDDSGHLVNEKWPKDGESSSDDYESSTTSSRSPSPETPIHHFLESSDVDSVMFYNEIIDLIRSGMADSVNADNTILMINASKHAYNIPIQEVPLAIIKAILEGPRRTPSATTPSSSSASLPALPSSSDLLQYVQSAVTFFATLLQHYIKGPTLQLRVVETLGDCAERQQSVLTILPRLLLLLYNTDIVEETAILKWYSQCSSSSSSSSTYDSKWQDVLAAAKPVVEWLENASEESSDDD